MVVEVLRLVHSRDWIMNKEGGKSLLGAGGIKRAIDFRLNIIRQLPVFEAFDLRKPGNKIPCQRDALK
jgi:hypothetical protein